MTTPQPPPDADPGPSSLASSLIALAGMPDDASAVDDQLVLIARLAADRVAAVDYASVTAIRQDAYTTVAASSELAVAVDQAQYAEQAGPCLEPLHTGAPAPVPDIAATMVWPGFRAQAVKLGLRASVSVPLYAGSGEPVAVLNLYGHDAAAMAPLTEAVWRRYKPNPAAGGEVQDLEPGAGELMAGLADAVAIRATIQQAIGVIMAWQAVGALDAYLSLRALAAESGRSLTTTAGAIIQQLSDRRDRPNS
jgi:GAF domain/ANTAR domain